MPRSQLVTINGKKITVKEFKIRELREDVLPKLSNIVDVKDMEVKETKDLIPVFESKLTEIFPEITEADIEESYPSEIEALIEAWVNVNFTGLKKLYRPVLALAKMGLTK